MKVGDLVTYAASGINKAVGIVLLVRTKTCLVRWSNGHEGNHSKQWLIKLKTSEDI